MRIIKRLERLAYALSESFPNLNSGGCCVAAAHIAYQLKYRHNIEVGIRVEIWSDTSPCPNIEVARANIKDVIHSTPSEWNSNGIHFWHVLTEFVVKGVKYHFDSNGIAAVDPDESGYEYSAVSLVRLYPGILTVEEALLLASKQKGWNETFNRKDIPALMDVIAEQLC